MNKQKAGIALKKQQELAIMFLPDVDPSAGLLQLESRFIATGQFTPLSWIRQLIGRSSRLICTTMPICTRTSQTMLRMMMRSRRQ